LESCAGRIGQAGGRLGEGKRRTLICGVRYAAQIMISKFQHISIPETRNRLPDFLCGSNFCAERGHLGAGRLGSARRAVGWI
jgi:hypothetical protein